MVNAFAANLEQFRYIERTPSETAAILLHMSSPNAGDIHNHLRDRSLRDNTRNCVLLRDLQSMSSDDDFDWPETVTSEGLLPEAQMASPVDSSHLFTSVVWPDDAQKQPVDEDTYFKNLALAVCPNGSEILLDNSIAFDENKHMNIFRVSAGPNGVALQERLMVKANHVAIEGQSYFAFEGKDYKIELESGDMWELTEVAE